MTDDDRARARLQRWRDHPITMVREEFQVEPDLWQAEALSVFPKVNRLAMKACKGPGKTAVLAWLDWNFLATRPHARIGATSITGDNLNQNLWPELAKWQQRSPYLSAMFTWTKTTIVSKAYPSTWWMQARTWPKQADPQQQADALAGLHEDYALWLLDESGGYPQAVMSTAEAVLLGGIETKVVQSGNPTHTTGPLYRACTTDRDKWHVITITGDPDRPDRSPRINLEEARQQIQSYGRDNPWVMVNVLGEFPPSSINTLLGVEDVERAMRRHLTIEQYGHAQKRLGVDVARFGDDRTVIFPRQGLAAFPPDIIRQQNTVFIAARVARAHSLWSPELIFVDDTGHWGHGVLDNLQTAGVPCLPINYAERSYDRRYKTTRDLILMEAAKWVKAGGALPPVPGLAQEMSEPTYTFIGGQFVVEDKDAIKKRIGRSTDLFDAFAQTFALPEMPGQVMAALRSASTPQVDFNPFERTQDDFAQHVGRVLHDYDPLKSE